MRDDRRVRRSGSCFAVIPAAATKLTSPRMPRRSARLRGFSLPSPILILGPLSKRGHAMPTRYSRAAKEAGCLSEPSGRRDTSFQKTTDGRGGSASVATTENKSRRLPSLTRPCFLHGRGGGGLCLGERRTESVCYLCTYQQCNHPLFHLLPISPTPPNFGPMERPDREAQAAGRLSASMKPPALSALAIRTAPRLSGWS